MSRIRIVALFAILAALATAFAACGGGSDGSSGEDPQTVVEGATLEGVKSGELELSLGVNSEGDEGGEIDVSLSGPFQAGEKGQLPQLDVSAKASGKIEGEAVDFEGSLTMLSDRAFIGYEGSEYEVDPTTFSFLKSSFEQAQQQGGENPADVTACQKAAESLKVGQFIDNMKNEGSADVEGASTTKVSGDLSASGAVDAIVALTEDPACSAQLEAAGPLPIGELEEAEGEISSALKKAHVEIYVGDDDIIRKLGAELTIEPKDAKNEKVEISLELTLSGVNEEQSISGPSSAKPLEDLFRQLGVNPLELFESGGSGGLGGLLEGLGGSSSGGGSSESGGSGLPSNQKEYVECLQSAESAADIQKCASLLQ